MDFWVKEIYALLKVSVNNVLSTDVLRPRLFLSLGWSATSGSKYLLEQGKVSPVRSRFLTGFSLLELTIVVVIVGILAMVTVPRFHGTVLRAERAEAEHALSLIRNAELAYREDYPGDFVGSFAALPWDLPDETKNFDYTIDAPGGRIIATNKRASRPNYRMDIVTGAVVEF